MPSQAIDAVLLPYKGHRTITELKQAAAAVQELYAKAGYGAVVAFIPEQSPAGGVVEIQVELTQEELAGMIGATRRDQA